MNAAGSLPRNRTPRPPSFEGRGEMQGQKAIGAAAGAPGSPGFTPRSHTPVYIVPPLRGSDAGRFRASVGREFGWSGAPEGRHDIDRGVNPGLPRAPAANRRTLPATFWHPSGMLPLRGGEPCFVHNRIARPVRHIARTTMTVTLSPAPSRLARLTNRRAARSEECDSRNTASRVEECNVFDNPSEQISSQSPGDRVRG